jgi:diguanylate cyclase (GGDEF)-like protein/PAS domain S-box-containing protein
MSVIRSSPPPDPGTATPELRVSAANGTLRRPPASTRPAWVRLFFLLVGFDLLAVLFCLFLNHRIATIYAGSIAVNQHWAERLDQYEALRELTGDINAPGNDVFDSHAVSDERATMNAARAPFNAALTAAKHELALEPSGPSRSRLQEDLATIDQTVTAMTEEAGLIFSYFERGQTEQAGARMATMDRKYAVVLRAFSDIGEHVRTIQLENFRDQAREAAVVRGLEWIVVALTVLMASGAVLYGRYLLKQAAVMARSREDEQRLLVTMENERRFRTLIEDGSDIILMLDREHVIRYASPSLGRVLGPNAGRMVDRPLISLIHPENAGDLSARCRRLFDHDGEAFSAPCRMQRDDGAWRTVEVRGHAATHTPFAAGDGIAVILSARDITDHLRAEADRVAIEHRFADILNIAADAIVAVDEDQRIILFNRGAERIFGYRPDEILGEPLGRLIPDGMATAHRDHVRAFADGPESSRGMSERRTISGRRKDGSVFPAETSISRNTHNGRTIFTAILRDVTERQRTDHALQASERRYRGLVENMHELVADVAPNGVIRSANRALCAVTGFSESELVGTNLFALMHPDDVDAAHRQYEGLLRHRASIRHWEHRLRRKDGGFVHVSTNGDPVYDPAGTLVSVAHVSFDLTAHKDAEATIRRLAYYDTLTGLPNRTMLIERVTHEIEHNEREGKPLALAVMNIDQFKEINNTLGHDHGDRLLQQLAARLSGLLRESDVVARLGDNQFAMLLPDTDLAGALHVGDKIHEALSVPFSVGTLSLTVDASVGLAICPDHATEADTLVQRAHVAMDTAKSTRSGRAVYSSEQDHYRPRRLALMSELHYAIEHHELTLFYQPRVAMRSGRVTGVEALVRWRHPQRGLIAPDEFIPLAEQSGLINPLTRWVLTAARDQALRWRGEGYRLTVAANLSARNLHDPSLPAFVNSLLTDDSRPWLELEITESTIMADPAGALDVLTQLHELKIPLAIDDFGTGYSSLAYLQKLPVSTIKIDKSFVKDMATNPGDAVIVRSTIDLAHNLGLTVVAEGVETAETWTRLADLGCDSAQGYHLCRPLPAEDFTAWLSTSEWAVGDDDERPSRAA